MYVCICIFICQFSYNIQVGKRLQKELELFPVSKACLASIGYIWHLLDPDTTSNLLNPHITMEKREQMRKDERWCKTRAIGRNKNCSFIDTSLLRIPQRQVQWGRAWRVMCIWPWVPSGRGKKHLFAKNNTFYFIIRHSHQSAARHKSIPNQVSLVLELNKPLSPWNSILGVVFPCN